MALYPPVRHEKLSTSIIIPKFVTNANFFVNKIIVNFTEELFVCTRGFQFQFLPEI